MGTRLLFLFSLAMVLLAPAGKAQQAAQKQSTPSSSSSSSARHAGKAAPKEGPPLDTGSVTNGLYRNAGFGFACKIPAGWVLRTEEMNAREDEPAVPAKDSAPKPLNSAPAPAERGRVLLAAFSRPPEAKAEDVNSSILIVAESAASYPGLKEAAQYFGPVAEIAKAQGFEVINEPYEFVQGTKTIVRGDFQRDVGTRMMWQSTLVILARGYVVSLTFIGGTEDEVEDFIEGLSFGVEARPRYR